MAIFLRIIKEKNKSKALEKACNDYRNNQENLLNFEIDLNLFNTIPGKPFSYWISNKIFQNFSNLNKFETSSRTAKMGIGTTDNYRFIRNWWEIKSENICKKWFTYVKGGPYSKFFLDQNLVINYKNDGCELKALISSMYGSWSKRIYNTEYFKKPGLTWSGYTTKPISARVLPEGCIFDGAGPCGFFDKNNITDIFANISILNSIAFSYLLSMRLGLAAEGRKQYTSGTINITPYPNASSSQNEQLSLFAKKSHSLKRNLDTINETSHTFILPPSLRSRFGDYNPVSIEKELNQIQNEIDDIAFDLYGFTQEDRIAATEEYENNMNTTNDDDEDSQLNATDNETLLSWAVGVVFGRFDVKLATGEKELPKEPDPFDPLPEYSPGMLQVDGEATGDQNDILVDDPMHPNDLTNLVQKVLDTVNVNIPTDIRQWITTKFFDFHLKMYSKSRRKAPIYWPLSSPNGLYRIWVYYPRLTDQTLYGAVNQYLDPKIKYVQQELNQLQNKSTNRTSSEEIQLEKQSNLEQDLISFREKLLEKAQTYKPHHDDGVEVTASPLANFFKHKSWNKALKTTWTKLDKGDYDWSYTAMDNWPERVREKCKKDKSLAIAHDLENVYIESLENGY